MIEVQFEYTEGSLKRIVFSGHSLFAPKGEDIHCAAVSFLAQFLEFVLMKSGVWLEREKRDGYLAMTLGSPLEQNISFLIEQAKEYLKVYEAQYGLDIIKVREVRSYGT